jgi:hypothetical protein
MSTNKQSQSIRPPSVSKRISIRFLSNKPQEKTATLVLNSGGSSNWYTDFRPYLDDPFNCEWAFGGVKKYLPENKCTWSHLVDNRAGTALPPLDVGRCEMLPNGDERETGEMLNPATRCVETYEEIWRDEEVLNGAKVVAAQLRHDEVVRGIFIQVGHWAQAVVRTDSDVSARRWKYNNYWNTTAVFGIESPAMLHLDGSGAPDTTVHILGTDDGSDSSDGSWEVTESYSWVL